MPVQPLHLGIRGRLFVLSIAVILVGILGAQWYASRALERDVETRTRAEITAQVALVAEAIRSTTAFEPERAQSLVRALSHASGARITLMSPDGRVIADSAMPASRSASASPAAPYRHGGLSQVQSSMVYVTRRIEGPGGSWTVRYAIAPHTFESAQAAMKRLLMVGGLLGLLAAASMSSLAVHLMARPVRDLTRTARAMLTDRSVRTRVRRDDEIGALANALDELADGLTRSLASLQQERDRLEAILEAMAEGVLVTDGQGTIVLANRALREMFLVGRDVIGRQPIEGVRNADLHDTIAEASRTRSAVNREISVSGVRPRRVLVRVTPLEDPRRGTVAVLWDVTELRRLETMRRDFVANVSHELRTPIAAVRAAVETLRDGALNDPEAAREFVSIIDRHTERLHRLVEDLLELSRIEARELKLALEPLDVTAVIRHTVDLFQLPASKKKIALHIQCEQNLPFARADRRALEHVLSNLIDNAIKYCPEGATVTVRARSHDSRVRVSIEDTGMGIEPRHLPRLFERFYRVDAGRSRQLGGTGLGLAIVKHLAEGMGATVSVESTVGRGTTFHVDLQASS